MRKTITAFVQLCFVTGTCARNASVQFIDPIDFATNANTTLFPHDTSPFFQVFDERFYGIIGTNPSIDLILEEASIPLYHEAGVYFSSDPPTVFATSNQYNVSASEKVTTIAKITQLDNGTWTRELISPNPPIPFVNGGFKYGNGVLFAAQGNLTADGGLTWMNAEPPYDSKVMLNSYFGIPFNSPNDVFVTSDGAIYFTDNPVGFDQGIRPAYTLPGATYRFVPNTTRLNVISDFMRQPNGITFSPDEQHAYITAMDGFLESDPQGKLTIYKYDVERRGRSSSSSSSSSPSSSPPSSASTTTTNTTTPPDDQPFLIDRRVFARAARGIADGVKTDTEGNVWAGCGDGVSVFSKAGVLLGKIIVGNGGVANFALGHGQVFMFNEKRLYLATVSGHVIGAQAVGL